MTDRILQKYAPCSSEGFTDIVLPEGEGTEDLGSFGWLRGVRERAIMLELRRKTGNIVAIGYGWIDRVEFDPSEGITLHVLGQKIRIKGRNLNAEVRQAVRLFDGIVRHRVPWVAEADQATALRANQNAVIVESILP